MGETPQTSGTKSADGSQASEVSRLSGRIVDDRYRLEEYLGGGGMGEVYRATHTLMQKTVAVKLLKPEVAEDESIIERFRREATAAANLEHPNICAATDFGKTDDGYFFLVMEYVDGRSLQDLLDGEGPLRPGRAAAIADGIAAALEKAAELEVVHRDIKPDNVMLVDGDESDPSVKVLDFGIAHVEFNDEMPSLTKTGAVFGTPTYMSPEQATGDEVEHRSDLYGLGVVLFEMLTGREVFDEEESARLMAAHITEQPEAPADVRDDGTIPPALDELVLDLLEKNPEDRPKSATDVRERLAPFHDRHAPADSSDASGAVTHRTADRTREDESTSTLERVTRQLREWTTTLDLGDSPATIALLALTGFLGLVLVGLAVASLVVLTSGSPQEARASLESQRAEFRKRAPIEKALKPADRGRPAESVERLRKLAEKRGDAASPHLHYLLGRKYAQIGNELKALSSYRAAAERNRDYLYDSEIRSELEAALGSDHTDLADRAAKFIETFRDHEGLQKWLAELAWRPDSDSTREHAYEVLESHGLLDEIPEVHRLSIELRRADSCDEYERHIDALVELGDPRGAEMIRIYEEKPRRGCGLLGVKDCYACVRGKLDEALDALED